MALQHTKAGEVVDLTRINKEKSIALLKHQCFEVMHLSISAGKTIAPHKVPGPITALCLTGACIFSVENAPRELTSGSWLYLEGGVMHAVEALEETQILVTILFNEVEPKVKKQ